MGATYNLEIPVFDFKGIKRIEIPKTNSDFVDTDAALVTIKKYLPRILATHKTNADKEGFLYQYMLGLQDIYKKERLYQKDSENNNQIVENHAFRQVNFKVGFLTGEKRDYTYKADSQSNDLTYLDRYFTDSDFFAKDKDLKEWIYSTGIGVTYTKIRTDIIVPDGVDETTGNVRYKFAGEEDGFDITTQAPFEFSVLEPTHNFVVYSSGMNKEPLFSVSIAEVDVGEGDEIDLRKQIRVETKYAYYETKSDFNFIQIDDLVKINNKVIEFLPMVEHSSNSSRLGLVELNRDLFNSVNTLISSVSDMIVDNANVILVFKNTDISKDDVLDMKKAGAVIIRDSQQSKQNSVADLDTIKVEINYEGLNTYYEQRISQMYDIAGVPLASGQVTSGGDTGQARLLGGGWNNAYTIINNDITTLLKGDYAVLKQILFICKQIPNNPINSLSASQIDIKYRINQNDNFLVKAQGIAQLAGVNFPKDEIVKASGLFSDTNAVATKWQAEIDKISEKNQENVDKSTKNVDNSNGNNSQE